MKNNKCQHFLQCLLLATDVILTPSFRSQTLWETWHRFLFGCFRPKRFLRCSITICLQGQLLSLHVPLSMYKLFFTGFQIDFKLLFEAFWLTCNLFLHCVKWIVYQSLTVASVGPQRWHWRQELKKMNKTVLFEIRLHKSISFLLPAEVERESPSRGCTLGSLANCYL